MPGQSRFLEAPLVRQADGEIKKTKIFTTNTYNFNFINLGLFDIIQKSKSHYQKRAYQCIKLLVALFSQCEAAKNLLEESEDIRQKWTWAVEWLNDELERARGPYPGSGQFSYNNWSPPAQSNETANGYFLERSQSARLTLEKACELLPEEVN